MQRGDAVTEEKLESWALKKSATDQKEWIQCTRHLPIQLPTQTTCDPPLQLLAKVRPVSR